MSLLRLLAAGKSLVGLKESQTRYRLTRQRLLPKFGAGKNPFGDRRKLETDSTERQTPGNDRRDGFVLETQSNPAASRAPEAAPCGNEEISPPSQGSSPQQANAVPQRRPAAFFSEWKTKLVGLLAKRSCKTATPAVGRFAKPPVQSELALDSIKVVRNDLRDTDVEILPAKSPSASAKPFVEKTEGAEQVWERVTARVLGAGKP
jgi:hypothetical protein